MKKFYFDKDFLKRYKSFKKSKVYSYENKISKSEYWQYFSNLIDLEINSHSISVNGKSGFYIPKKIRILNVFINYLKKSWKNLSINFISYEKAFINIMNSKLQDISSSKQAVNFKKKIVNNDGNFFSIADIQNNFSSKYLINDQIIYSYYIFNILNSYTHLPDIKTFLEIGAGNGNFLSIIHKNVPGATIIDVDLPETLSHAILFISDLYPNAKILMPNEVKGKNFNNYDFIFLTPSQIDLIKDDSIDVFLNTFSFQEMTYDQINEYFNLIQRSGRDKSLFLSANRVEKRLDSNLSPKKDSSENTNKFSEYPWRSSNDVIYNDTCEFMQQVQRHSISIRLEILNSNS